MTKKYEFKAKKKSGIYSNVVIFYMYDLNCILHLFVFYIFADQEAFNILCNFITSKYI